MHPQEELSSAPRRTVLLSDTILISPTADLQLRSRESDRVVGKAGDHHGDTECGQAAVSWGPSTSPTQVFVHGVNDFLINNHTALVVVVWVVLSYKDFQYVGLCWTG